MDRPKDRGRNLPALLGLIAVIALNTWFAVASVKTLLRSEAWLAHTWQVIGDVERMMSSAKDAETGTRGYLITGEDKYLKAYNDARRELPGELDEFRIQTEDNAHQRPNAVAARAIVEQRLAMLQGSIDARRSHGYDAARAMMVSGTGFEQMTQLRNVADQMESEERRLLTIRIEDAKRSGTLAFFAISLASALDLLLLLLVFWYLVRQRELRFASEDAAERLAKANEEIARNTEAVRVLNRELEDRVRIRTAELESTNRELEAFSYSVSHDLRAPLRTIDGFSLALQEDYTDAVDATGRDYIARVRAGVQRMGGLIDALLQLSRITRAEVVREDVSVSHIAETVAANLRDENPSQTIHFEIEPDMRANADRSLLQVALENLMGNAVKFSSKKPESHIRVSFDTGQQAYLVQDNGAGFDMHYSEKLFNAFNRLHGDKDFKGSGIGLATVARVVRRHHGHIRAESEVGNGARFWFTLG